MVESYLEHIGTLLLEDLRTKGEDSDARLLARARTSPGTWSSVKSARFGR
jgi:hypothetical protein